MPSSAFVRLGPTSAEKSAGLDRAPFGNYNYPIEITCAQVPTAFEAGSPVWLWLGSDNNKGIRTSWTQGIRAFCVCESNEKIPGSKEYRVVLSNVYLLPRSISKLELLKTSPETYADALADAAIVGLDNYSSQVVQILTDDQFATIGAMIADMLPEVLMDLSARIPAITDVVLRVPEEHLPVVAAEEELLLPSLKSELESSDPVLNEVLALVKDGAGGILLVGPPGTGKSWYAKQIALHLTDGDQNRIRQVQFHPGYQYEDFVEGYAPRGSTGFQLQDRHLLKMIEVADKTKDAVVLVIDELSRTDPARVMGEAMTYMESSLRGVAFTLPSGRRVSIPSNLVFLATMNPDDRSVDEIDDAMDRRWAKVRISPDVKVLRNFLQANGATPQVVGALVQFFTALQSHISLGHAYFRGVSSLGSLKRLWDSQLQHAIYKRFRYDQETRKAVEMLWLKCLKDCESPLPAEGAGNTA